MTASFHSIAAAAARHTIELQSDWYVSASPNDAGVAARQKAWTPEQLELGMDPLNHPCRIDLPGGPQFGKRPLGASTERSPTAILDPADREELEHWVGFMPELDPAQARLPSPYLTYARTIEVPSEMAGKRLFLTLDEARYHVTGSIDGKTFCHYLGGLEPRRFDVTDQLVPGRTSLLQITVGDCGVSANRPFDPYLYTGNRLPNCAQIRNNLTHPVNYGGSDRAVRRVTLDAVAPVYLDWILAQPRVQRGQIDLSLRLVNTTPQDVEVMVVTVADSDLASLRAPDGRARAEAQHRELIRARIVVPARGHTLLKRTVDWSDAHLWDLDSPTLYNLGTSISQDDRTVDVHREVFGFREFLINGHSYFLNGKKIHLIGQAGHVTRKQEAWPLEEKMAFLRQWKERCHITHLRIHAKPWDRSWVLAADRVGLLITTETALWTTGYASFDWAGSEEACYQNVRTHFLEGVVRRDRNNPSVIMWSLSNEMSPITPWDLEDPRMAAMNRTFRRIIDETKQEDDSRVIQMSSAMDFLGRLDMYNLHYPKSWQAFPDYPRTGYWLDEGFLFPWYGPAKKHLAAWSWRKDKPLYFGEFGCVVGVTPDPQATLIGDAAFDEPDWGSALAQRKIWLSEIPAYRRMDVSGFCAWIPMFGGDIDPAQQMTRPNVVAHAQVCRHLGVLAHGYQRHFFTDEEVALDLSIHNDTRHDTPLYLTCSASVDGKMFWSESSPSAVFGPAQSRSLSSRFRAPLVEEPTQVTYRSTLRSDGRVVDDWSTTFHIGVRKHQATLPESCAFFDPDGRVEALIRRRGIIGGTFLSRLDADDSLSAYSTIWLGFQAGAIRRSDWLACRSALLAFARGGGCVVLDQAADIESDPALRLKPFQGFAQPGDRLEVISAWIASPHHPIMAGLLNQDFDLWGRDYYVARRCTLIPQEGRYRPLLVAGADRHGLTGSPLSEVLIGRGSVLVSHLELLTKLDEHPPLARLVTAIGSYRPMAVPRSTGVCVGSDTLARLREVGLESPDVALREALEATVAIIDGERLEGNWIPAVQRSLSQGRTAYLHDLSVAQTRELLSALSLPGRVLDGRMPKGQNDAVRHSHPLGDGLTGNQLFWTVGKANTAPWTHARHHPHPASALIQLDGSGAGASLTRRGAITVYPVDGGTLVLDHLRWQLRDLEEPDRARRLIMILLTNAGVPLDQGAAKSGALDYETAADRRERGMF